MTYQAFVSMELCPLKQAYIAGHGNTDSMVK